MKCCMIDGCEAPMLAKGFCSKHWQRLRRNGHLDLIRRAKGTFTIRPDGRRMITRNGKQIREHIAIVESALGHPLPAGACVHHVDGDPGNNAANNLIVCPSDQYHKLLHVRSDAMNACGNPTWRKCGLCKVYDSPANLQQHGTREAFYHKRCAANYQRARRNA